MSNETIVGDFFARWGQSFDEMCTAFEAVFAPECRWDQRPLALTVGPEEAVKLLRRSAKLAGLATIDVDVLKIASAGDSVLCERIDHLRKADGSLIASAPVAGVLEFEDGKVVHWREYYDPLGFFKQACLNGIKAPFRRARAA